MKCCRVLREKKTDTFIALCVSYGIVSSSEEQKEERKPAATRTSIVNIPA